MDKRAIGVFDSGIGGLTVVSELRRQLPHESLIYIGDTARVPYGTRSRETIRRFALEVTQKLLEQQVKLIVVACNTISAVALDEVIGLALVPVIGVITPTVKKALETTKTGRIAVIGTSATIGSGIYGKKIREIDPHIKVFELTTPLLVPIAEEGLFNHQVAGLMVREYLHEIKADQDIDTLILGCTHYPLFREVIENFLGKRIKIIDSAQPTAEAVNIYLEENNLKASGAKPTQIYFTSDEPGKSHDIAKAFLGEELELNKISI